MPGYSGHVDDVNASGLITGWAVDRADPSTPARLTVLLDGTPIGNIRCADLRDDVQAAGFGTAAAGFSISLPERFLDGQERQISFRPVAGGDPFTLEGLGTIMVAAPPRGGVTLDRDTFTLSGWVAGPSSAVRPVFVEILLDAVPLKAISCWASSSDGHDERRVLFKVTLEKAIFEDPVIRMLEVRIPDTGELLAGGPIPTRLSKPLGFFDLLLGRRIVGWGFDVGLFTAPKLAVCCDDVPVMEITGTNFRRDLFDLYGARSGGFDVVLPLNAFSTAETVSIRFPNGMELPGGPMSISQIDRDLARVEDVLCAMTPDQPGLAAVDGVAAQMPAIAKVVMMTVDNAKRRAHRARAKELSNELLAQTLLAATSERAFEVVRSLLLLAINPLRSSEDFHRVVAVLRALDEDEADIYGLIELERQRRRPLWRLLMAAMLLTRGSADEGVDLIFEAFRSATKAEQSFVASLGAGLLVRAGRGSEAQRLLVASML